MPNLDPIPSPFSSTAGGVATAATSGNNASLEVLFGPKLVRRDGTEIETRLLVANVVGIYFSAHWCPPCRHFTPTLAEVYGSAVSSKKSFEVVFVSSDRSIDQFYEYFASMGDWLAVPFTASRQKESLKQRFSVGGIPCLVLLNGSTGQLITIQGRERVASGGVSFVRSLPRDIDADVPNDATMETLIAQLDESSGSNVLSQGDKKQGLAAVCEAIERASQNPKDLSARVVHRSDRQLDEKLSKHPAFYTMLKLNGFREASQGLVCYRMAPETFEDSLMLLRCIITSLE